MNVTTTSARQGRFETRFWHKVFEEECARLPGHFGPINTIAISPDGKGYASGGEDGYGEFGVGKGGCSSRLPSDNV